MSNNFFSLSSLSPTSSSSSFIDINSSFTDIETINDNNNNNNNNNNDFSDKNKELSSSLKNSLSSSMFLDLTLEVTKRNGHREPMRFDKITNRIINLVNIKPILTHVQPTIITQKVVPDVTNGMKTSDIDILAAEYCSELITIHKNYGLLAARIEISNLQKNTNSNFYDTMKSLYEYNIFINGEYKHSPLITKDLLTNIEANNDIIQKSIDYNRDFVFDFFGVKTLMRSYLLKKNDIIVERPQHMFMRVAISIHGLDIDKIIETYNMLSNGKFIHATPTLFSSGTPSGQLSSCFLLDMKEDSISGIYDTLKDCALISKDAGGVGLYISNIRSEGAYIRGSGGKSNGIIPMLKVFNETARYVDQCFYKDTIILTKNRGLVKISDIISYELLNGDIINCDYVLSQNGNWIPVKKVFKKNVDDFLLKNKDDIKDENLFVKITPYYGIDNNDVYVTHNHPIYVYDIKLKNEMYIDTKHIDLKKHCLVYNIPRLNDDIINDDNDDNNNIIIDENNLLLSSIYILYGSLHHNKKSDDDDDDNINHVDDDDIKKNFIKFKIPNFNYFLKLKNENNNKNANNKMNIFLSQHMIKNNFIEYFSYSDNDSYYNIFSRKENNFSKDIVFEKIFKLMDDNNNNFEFNKILLNNIKFIEKLILLKSIIIDIGINLISFLKDVTILNNDDFNFDNSRYYHYIMIPLCENKESFSYFFYYLCMTLGFLIKIENKNNVSFKNENGNILNVKSLYILQFPSLLYNELLLNFDELLIINENIWLSKIIKNLNLTHQFFDNNKIYQNILNIDYYSKYPNNNNTLSSLNNEYLYDLECFNNKNIKNDDDNNLTSLNEPSYTTLFCGIVHNGGGRRKGSFAVYLEPWHPDIESFLELRKNNGKEEERTRDLFTALWIPDLFMKRVESNSEWSLFCPGRFPNLCETYGEEFEKIYLNLELDKSNIKKSVKARDIWKSIIISQIETGSPYMLYKDACNYLSNQKNIGIIKSSNLCTEIIEHSSKDETGVCNLASISLPSCIIDIPNILNMETKTTRLLLKKINGDDNINNNQDGNNNINNDDDDDNCDINNNEENNDNNNNNNSEYNNSNNNYYGVKIFQDIENNCERFIYIPRDYNLYASHRSIKKGFDLTELFNITCIVTKNLNMVIDKTSYPTKESEYSNKKNRPIGIGVQGLSDIFSILGVPFDEYDAFELNKLIFEVIYYSACFTSCELSKNNGKPYESFYGSPISKGIFHFDLWKDSLNKRFNYDENYKKKYTSNYLYPFIDWESLRKNITLYGVNNSLFVALMPTASTSQILGNTECFEPITENLYIRRVLKGEFIVVNKYLQNDLIDLGLWNSKTIEFLILYRGSIQDIPYIPDNIKKLYKTVWEIKQKVIINMAKDRAPFIDQSQSMNLFLKEPTINKISSMHMFSWKSGLKTGMYYLRTLPAANPIQFSIDSNKLENERLIMIKEKNDIDKNLLKNEFNDGNLIKSSSSSMTFASCSLKNKKNKNNDYNNDDETCNSCGS